MIHWALPPHRARVLDVRLQPVGSLAQDLLVLTARIGARAEGDPFGNLVLLVALAISRRMAAGTLRTSSLARILD